MTQDHIFEHLTSTKGYHQYKHLVVKATWIWAETTSNYILRHEAAFASLSLDCKLRQIT